jgi:outer membrane protein assembly factor BamD (BamD/ComL family)
MIKNYRPSTLRKTALTALLLVAATTLAPAADTNPAAANPARRSATHPAFFTLEWDATTGYRVRTGALLTGNNLDTHAMRYEALQTLTEARRAQLDGSNSKALGLYEKLCRKNPGSDIAAEAFFQRGVIETQRHEFEEAFNCLDIVAKNFPDFDRFGEVIELQFRLASDVKNGARPYLWGVIPWFKNPVIGIDFFERVNRNAPYGKHAPQALFDKGNLALDNDHTDEALEAFDRLITDYPESKLVPESWLALARTHEAEITGHAVNTETPSKNATRDDSATTTRTVTGHEWDQGATKEALYNYNEFIHHYKEFARRDPAFDKDGKLAALAVHNAARMREILARNRYDLGLFYFEHRNNPRAAALFFNEAINAAPESGVAREARKRIAEIRDGAHATAGMMDWLFGRYPQYKDTTYPAIPAAPDTALLGFRTEAPKP